MKITLDKSMFEKKLQLVVSVIREKSFIPILDEGLLCVSGEGKNARLTLLGAKGDEMSLETSMPVISIEGDKEDFVCDLDIILRTLSTIKSDEVELEIQTTEENTRKGPVIKKNVIMSIPKRKKTFSIPINYKAENFPKISREWNESFALLSGSLFAEMIKIGSQIVNPNVITPHFSGVNIEMIEDKFVFKSGSSSLIFKGDIPIKNKIDNFSGIILPKSISNVSSSYASSEEIKVYRDSNDSNVKIEDGICTLIVRSIDAKFPPIKGVLETQNNEVFMTVNRDEIMNSVKRVSNYGSDGTKTYLVSIDYAGETEINVTGENRTFRKKATEAVPFEKKHEGMNFITNLNANQLQTIFTTLRTEYIHIHQDSKSSFLFIREEETDGSSVLWINSPSKA